MMKQRQ
ncbi:hypothetical protein E2C01_098388 [Portunus trituberculatus]|nr:hypothetical protein [Portunus trituberculatus]